MPTDTQLTGGTCPLIISGKEFKAKPFTDRDYAELDEYVQHQIIQLARNSCKGLSAEERKETIAASISTAVGVRWNSDEGTRFLFDTPYGQAYLVWCMIRKVIPLQDFVTLFLNKEHYGDNIEESFRIFDKLNFLPEEEQKDVNSEEEKN